MQITRTSMFTGVIRTMELPITEAQLQRWKDGLPVQNAFPALSVSEREFLITGTTDEEWDEAFPEEEPE